MRPSSLLSIASTAVLLFSCSSTPEDAAPVKVTILQTADIHGQVYPHSELFYDNDEISYKTLGGLANMKTLFDQEREANPNTIILDGGDLIQGSAVAALSEGAAFSSNGFDIGPLRPSPMCVLPRNSS